MSERKTIEPKRSEEDLAEIAKIIASGVGGIYTTRAYHLFSFINGNRAVDAKHKDRLRKSMKNKYLNTAICVTENFEIVDGQHRFEVVKELGFPLYFTISRGYGLDEVHTYNHTSKTWTYDDYLSGYSTKGYQDYIEFSKFKSKFGFNFSECMLLLGGDDGGVMSKNFQSGKFKIKNLKVATMKAEKIIEIGKFTESICKRTSFIRAMIRILDRPDLNYVSFIQKLKKRQDGIPIRATIAQFIDEIETFYNYREKDKINLRFKPHAKSVGQLVVSE